MDTTLSYEEFQEFYNKYPHGNPKEGYNSFVYAISFRTMPDGEKVSWDILKKKWTEYYVSCQQQGQKMQYMKKISKFADDQEYLSKFTMTNNYIDRLKELYNLS